MPIYEYQCAECAQRTEVLQKVSEPPLTDCPACGKPALRKLVSAAAFQLKGTGWYETDFKNKGREKARANGEGKSEAGGESKSDSAAGDKQADTRSSSEKKEVKSESAKSGPTSAAAD